ncbi:hypothetical protein BJX66DRAFT_293768 [Aspergillus keveii]|uniref:Uncharacterized protein n=1 Tax=Aspergillus keveii TaxID=714993 RepID=A0ABR4GK41_9EURO
MSSNPRQNGSKSRLARHGTLPFPILDPGVSDARDGPGAEAAFKTPLGAPQYKYCLIVDEVSLENHKAARGDSFRTRYVPVTLIPAHWDLEEYDGRWSPEVDDDQDGFYQLPEIEGTTNPFVGWMLLGQEYITSVYDRLIVEDWYDIYVRPPRVYPDETDELWKVP